MSNRAELIATLTRRLLLNTLPGQAATLTRQVIRVAIAEILEAEGVEGFETSAKFERLAADVVKSCQRQAGSFGLNGFLVGK